MHFRLSREKAPKAQVSLSIGARRFTLTAGGADAWAPDKRVDAAIIAAIRSGTSMSVQATGKNGAPFADVYALRGAAQAMDAAALGCARLRSTTRWHLGRLFHLTAPCSERKNAV